jgi:hypothetical protein
VGERLARRGNEQQPGSREQTAFCVLVSLSVRPPSVTGVYVHHTPIRVTIPPPVLHERWMSPALAEFRVEEVYGRVAAFKFIALAH